MSKTNTDSYMRSSSEIVVDAIYGSQVIEDYEGNPLIEALPPIFTEDEMLEHLSVFPSFNEEERELNATYRFHCIQRLFQYFQPFESHFDLEQRISRAIRQGYLHRRPNDSQAVERIHESYQAIKNGEFISRYQTTVKRTASGFTIVGLSGIGKSTAIERILTFYPQIIQHSEYNGVPFRFVQICWLKLECPFDGSLKGLCISFFAELDRLLGTSYLNKFGSQKNTLDLMLQRMTHLANLHGLGLLIIDEIQHLNLQKSGGSDKMLNFFVTLVNTIGIPVILVGTNKAVSVLQSEFRQARRGSGQGDMIWGQMPKDDTWDLFVEGMWEYQWTQHFVPLTESLNELLYEESQGILDIAVKLFMLAQVKAIATGKEKIGKQLIRQVANESLRLVKPMLQALKSGIPSEIAKYEDIRPIDMDEELEKYRASIDMHEKVRLQKKLQEKKRQQKAQSLTEDLILSLLPLGFEGHAVEKTVKNVLERYGEEVEKTILIREASKLLLENETEKENKTRISSKSVKKDSNVNVLGRLVKEARQQKLSVYEMFLMKGFIKNPLEEKWEEDAHVTLVSDSVS